MNERRIIDDTRITTFGHLVEAHSSLWKTLDEEMNAAVGLPLLWYAVLLLIGRSANGFRPMHELINATAFTSGGVTRLVDRMEQAGFVERQSCPNDRRVTYVALTARGREMLERSTAVHLRGIQEHVVDVLDPAEVAQLDAILTKLVTARERDR